MYSIISTNFGLSPIASVSSTYMTTMAFLRFFTLYKGQGPLFNCLNPNLRVIHLVEEKIWILHLLVYFLCMLSIERRIVSSRYPGITHFSQNGLDARNIFFICKERRCFIIHIHIWSICTSPNID